VILKNVSSATNGKYKCVVSAEGNFQTMYDSKDIAVVGESRLFSSISFSVMNIFQKIGMKNEKF